MNPETEPINYDQEHGLLVPKANWERRFDEGWGTSRLPEPNFLKFLQEHEEEIGPKVLDIGSGDGRHLVPLAQAGYEVTGLELAENGLELTREKLEKLHLHADLVQGNFRELPFKDNSFDTIISITVFQHNDAPNAKISFKEASRVLKPNGLFFLRVRSLEGKVRENEVVIHDTTGRTHIEYDGPARIPMTLHDYSLEEIYDLAKTNELEIVDEPVDERVPGGKEKGQWNVVFRKINR